MKRFIKTKRLLYIAVVIGVCVFASAFVAADSGRSAEPSDSDIVYICTGSSSTRYHATSTCRGLSRCSGNIVKVTRKQAEDTYKRTPCKICKP